MKFNPITDVTPAELVGVLVTEEGALRAPYDRSILGAWHARTVRHGMPRTGIPPSMRPTAPEAEATETVEENTETEAPAEPEAAADGVTEAADAEAAAPEAGETEDKAASGDAEDEKPAQAGDSDEDSAA